jgi:hypothetical protein
MVAVVDLHAVKGLGFKECVSLTAAVFESKGAVVV